MAVTFDAAGGGIATSTVVGVCTFTIAANACLVVGVAARTNVSISACTVNGTQMTQIGRVVNDTTPHSETFYCLTAAPSGVVSISAGIVGGAATTIWLAGASYLGGASANTFGGVNTGTATNAATFTLSVSTSTTDCVVLFATGTSNMTATNSTTRLQDSQHSVSKFCDVIASSNVISLSASCVTTTQNLAFMALNIRATDPNASTNFIGGLSLQGVGL